MSTIFDGRNDKWYQRMWLSLSAMTYIAICVFDFMIMPIYTAAHNSKIESLVFRQLEGTNAAQFADTLVKSGQATRQWNPLTLLGGGMFHLAFGALLTGGAISRGFAIKSEVEGYYKSQTPTYASPYTAQDRRGSGYVPQQQTRTRASDPRPPVVSQDLDGPMPRTVDFD